MSCQRRCNSDGGLSFDVFLVRRIHRKLYTVFSTENKGGDWWCVVIWEDLLSDLTSQLSQYPNVSYDLPKMKEGNLNVTKDHLIPEILFVIAVLCMVRFITLNKLSVKTQGTWLSGHYVIAYEAFYLVCRTLLAGSRALKSKVYIEHLKIKGELAMSWNSTYCQRFRYCSETFN
jgi:hypothetical protein